MEEENKNDKNEDNKNNIDNMKDSKFSIMIRTDLIKEEQKKQELEKQLESERKKK